MGFGHGACAVSIVPHSWSQSCTTTAYAMLKSPTFGQIYTWGGSISLRVHTKIVKLYPKYGLSMDVKRCTLELGHIPNLKTCKKIMLGNSHFFTKNVVRGWYLKNSGLPKSETMVKQPLQCGCKKLMFKSGTHAKLTNLTLNYVLKLSKIFEPTST